jgi:hypothetical protein
MSVVMIAVSGQELPNSQFLIKHVTITLMKSPTKVLLERVAPGLLNAIRTVRNRRYFRKRFSTFHAVIKSKLFSYDKAIVVQSGPFYGLRYFDEIVWGSIAPKWLGSYEAELHPVIHQIIKRGYSTIIDVGCAEGYYAVGLAVALPASKIFAFDTDFVSRKQLSKLARLNHAEDRIILKRYCAYSDLDAISNADTLLICDIEGHELHLLDPDKAEALLLNDILVEVHDEAGKPATIEMALCQRFGVSHIIERIMATDRDLWIKENKGILSSLPEELLTEATKEHRNAGEVWLWMQTKYRRATA